MQAESVLPGGCTKGELTRPGQLQSRELGQQLRQRYIQELQFISPQYQVHSSRHLKSESRHIVWVSHRRMLALSCSACRPLTCHDRSDISEWLTCPQSVSSWQQSCVCGVLQDTEVEARSTNYRRTTATVQGVLTGLWPDTRSAVPVRVAEDVDEVLFGRTDSCERLRDLMKQQAKALKGETASRVEALSRPSC